MFSHDRWNRRQLLQVGAGLLAGGGLLGLGLNGRAQAMGGIHSPLPFDPQESLRSFERGRVVDDNGRRVRVFEVEARSITVPLGGGALFKAWTLNGRVPGPTLRAQEGERIRVVFRNGDS
ncbi:MAG: multicopper oxidase domain-containing protein, partial [Cyanobium sp.]